MKIEIYVYEPGKAEGFYKKAIAEYAKRLTRYCPIEYKQIKKEKEWRRLLEKKQAGYAVIAGETISSEEFSENLKNKEVSGEKSIIYYIMKEKDYDSLKEEYTDSLQNVFSVSNYDMSPMMQTLILHEQIYRGYRIMNNHPYHK